MLAGPSAVENIGVVEADGVAGVGSAAIGVPEESGISLAATETLDGALTGEQVEMGMLSPSGSDVVALAPGAMEDAANAEALSEAEGANVPSNPLHSYEGVLTAINENADQAVSLTRGAILRGEISNGAQSFGTRAHSIFEDLNDQLDVRLESEGSPFTLSTEEFRNEAGDLTSRRAPGSIGADVIVRNTIDDAFIQILDLKTHGGVEIPISPARQQQFLDRFGANVEEIYRQR
jgi:hypothetical protein